MRTVLIQPLKVRKNFKNMANSTAPSIWWLLYKIELVGTMCFMCRSSRKKNSSNRTRSWIKCSTSRWNNTTSPPVSYGSNTNYGGYRRDFYRKGDHSSLIYSILKQNISNMPFFNRLTVYRSSLVRSVGFGWEEERFYLYEDYMKTQLLYVWWYLIFCFIWKLSNIHPLCLP